MKTYRQCRRAFESSSNPVNYRVGLCRFKEIHPNSPQCGIQNVNQKPKDVKGKSFHWKHCRCLLSDSAHCGNCVEDLDCNHICQFHFSIRGWLAIHLIIVLWFRWNVRKSKILWINCSWFVILGAANIQNFPFLPNMTPLSSSQLLKCSFFRVSFRSQEGGQIWNQNSPSTGWESFSDCLKTSRQILHY